MTEMTELDIIVLALVAWKEARGGGIPGLTSVMNVVLNRAAQHKTSVYAQVFEPYQFSSMTWHRDPQYYKQPAPSDPSWNNAVTLAVSASTGALEDITANSTFYYATSMDANPPSWAKTMTPTVVIGDQRFFRA